LRRDALLSRVRLLAFLAATGLAIAGIAGAGSADAGGPPAPPNYTYSSAVTAIALQIALQRNPDFSSLPDPLDIEAPDSEAQLDSFGTSQADGHVANLNGLGGVPGLVCLAAPAGTCGKIPIGTLTGGLISAFPPPDPLDASASYPATPSAKAPNVGGKATQASINTSGFSLGAGAANATAEQYSTGTQVALQNLGLAGVLSIGSATTSTTQTATANALTTVATADLSGISLGGRLLTIGSMDTTTTVVSKPGKPGTDTTSTVLGNVKAAGLPATIDASGIHIGGKALPANLVADVQKLVNQVLGKAGIHLSLAEVKSSNGVDGHTVAASSLKLTFDHTLTGTQPITVAPPTGIPCPPLLQNFPVDPCSGVSFTLDGAYHGQIALGQVGVVSLAQPGGPAPSVPPPSGTTTPPTTSPGTVGPGSVGTGPIPPEPGTSTVPVPGSTQPPMVASEQRTVADQLKGVSHRIEWFFPLLALGLLALIGRFRTPARFPSTDSNST
jgi:hypothetical protein